MPVVRAGNTALDRLSNLIKQDHKWLESGLRSLSLSFSITGIFLSLGFLNTTVTKKQNKTKTTTTTQPHHHHLSQIHFSFKEEGLWEKVDLPSV